MNKKKAPAVKKVTEAGPKKLTKKFLLEVADSIYNPKTGAFMKLCEGTLCTFDRKIKKTVHCGIGELYFQLTGEHPGFLTTSSAASFIVGCSTLGTSPVRLSKREQAQFSATEKFVSGLARSDLRTALLEELNETKNTVIANRDSWRQLRRSDFHGEIVSIADENDRNVTYKVRAQRVAAQMRKAALLLLK
jgi:hypothetical protein